jgi:Iap family predicted aminopeptidase
MSLEINSDLLWSDLAALCSFGGRFAGTPSELQARDFLRVRLAELTKHDVQTHCVPYDGWSRESWQLELLGHNRRVLSSHPLVRSPSTAASGIDAEVIDLGRGALGDFESRKEDIPGRFVLVRHEYMFSSTHIHRRVKYGWAKERAAAGFLIASDLPGELVVTGSSGDTDLPALGITQEGATALSSSNGYARIHVQIKTRREAASAENIIVEIPGQTDEWVVVCAHYDGHDLAQSAIDNGTGVAAALALARSFAAVATLRRGLRVIFFTIEEWGLLGSRAYVDQLSEAERRRIALVINFDSLVGGSKLTALISEFADLESWLGAVSDKISTYFPMMANSDHYNFARHGIPALRLVSGFDEPESGLRYLLTSGDTSDRINRDELFAATETAARVAYQACSQPSAIARRK